jgi:hypothetical protein
MDSTFTVRKLREKTIIISETEEVKHSIIPPPIVVIVLLDFSMFRDSIYFQRLILRYSS